MKELSKQDIEVVLAGKGLPGELLVGESLAKYFARLYLATKDSRDEQLSQRDAQIAALTTDANALRADGVKQFANQQRRIAIEQEKFGDYEFSRHCSISADEADEFAVAIRERNDG